MNVQTEKEVKALERWVLGRPVEKVDRDAIEAYLLSFPQATVMDAYFIMVKGGVALKR